MSDHRVLIEVVDEGFGDDNMPIWHFQWSFVYHVLPCLVDAGECVLDHGECFLHCVKLVLQFLHDGLHLLCFVFGRRVIYLGWYFIGEDYGCWTTFIGSN